MVHACKNSLREFEKIEEYVYKLQCFQYYVLGLSAESKCGKPLITMGVTADQ
jgi:hypothetical protein